MKPAPTPKAVRDPEAQRAHVQAVVDQSDAKIQAIKAEIQAATTRLENAHTAYVRGNATEREVMDARTAMEAAQKRLIETQQLAEAARKTQPTIDMEVLAAQRAHVAALRARAAELIEPIKARIAADKKIRAALVEIYGLSANTDTTPQWVDWEALVSDCFPMITGEEATASVDAAKAAVLA